MTSFKIAVEKVKELNTEEELQSYINEIWKGPGK